MSGSVIVSVVFSFARSVDLSSEVATTGFGSMSATSSAISIASIFESDGSNGGDEGGPSSNRTLSDLFLLEAGVGDDPRKPLMISSGGYTGLVCSSIAFLSAEP